MNDPSQGWPDGAPGDTGAAPDLWAPAEHECAPAAPGGSATASLVLGILGVIFGVLCCGAGIFGLGSSILAWILGAQELKGIAEGRSSPAGYGQARTGMILGIVGTVLCALWMIGAVLYYVFVIALTVATAAR